MFDSLLTRCVTPKSVTWDSPKTLIMDLGDGREEILYTLMKGAESFLYKQIDIKSQTSKDLYKQSKEMWKEFIDAQLYKAKDKVSELQSFYLDKSTLVYLVNDSNEIIDIADMGSLEELEEFKIIHKNYITDVTTINNTKKFYTDGKNGLVKLVCYDKDEDIVENDYTPVLILEYNNKKSEYYVYSGILIYKDFVFIPQITYEIKDTSLIKHIKFLDMENLLEYSKKRSFELYELYLDFLNNPVEISVREMQSITNQVGIKLFIDEEGKIGGVEGLSEELNGKKIQEYYNTFKDITGETVGEIMNLTDIRKTFRYNKLTLFDMLAILSKEYLTFDGSKVTAEKLSSIVIKLSSQNGCDNSQIEYVQKDLDTN